MATQSITVTTTVIAIWIVTATFTSDPASCLESSCAEPVPIVGETKTAPLAPLSEVAMINPAAVVFHAAAEQWRRETRNVSSMSVMVMHPAYQRIVGLGQDAVGLLLKELEERKDFWFWALASITGANPVKPGHEGRISLMAADWIEWGRQHSYI
jgi:hypothetical protein